MTAIVTHHAVVRQLMGLPWSLHFRGPGVETAREAAAAQAFAEVERLDRVFSPFRADSAVSRIDRGELTADGAGPLVAEVLGLVGRARELTHGWFDCWFPAPERGPRRRFDPSGLVKGWAAERVLAILRGLDPEDDVHVNAGGDVAAWSHGQPWRVGVEDPTDPTRMIRVVEVADGAVATSGRTYRGDHVVDPRTGAPARGLLSVTVTGPRLLWADVLATAVLAAGPDRFAEASGWLPGYAVLAVTDGGWALAAGDPGAPGAPGVADRRPSGISSPARADSPGCSHTPWRR